MEKQSKNSSQKIIEDIVVAFYQKATSDFMIGYHFRKIVSQPETNPLYPSLDSFSEHIPRIIQFWCDQLQINHQYSSTQFDLINVHQKLNVRKGEIGRWILLFNETLEQFKDKSEQHQLITKQLKEKVVFFQEIMMKKLF